MKRKPGLAASSSTGLKTAALVSATALVYQGRHSGVYELTLPTASMASHSRAAAYDGSCW